MKITVILYQFPCNPPHYASITKTKPLILSMKTLVFYSGKCKGTYKISGLNTSSFSVQVGNIDEGLMDD